MTTIEHFGCIGDGCPHCVKIAEDPDTWLPIFDAMNKPQPKPVPSRVVSSRPKACAHRGVELELVECKTCGGNTKARVHACSIHGKCTQFMKPLPHIKACATCADQQYHVPKAHGPTVQVVSTANGIGDCILGLTLLDGLRKKHPDHAINVVGKPWCLPWAQLFQGMDGLETDAIPGAISYYPYDTYTQQTFDRLARPRWEYYGDACGVKAVPPRPRPVSQPMRDWARPYAGRIVLAPGATDVLRTWSLPHWLTLEEMLLDRGFDVAIVDDKPERVRKFRSDKLVSEPAARVGAVLHAALAVVGNDSGMCHVAAALGTPTVVLTASIMGDKVFGIYPTASVVQGPLSCGGCHGRDRPDGKASRAEMGCLQSCHNLQAIAPATVLAAIEKAACWRARPYTLLTPDRLASLRRAVRETAHLAGDLAELGVYRGGSALAMADAAPTKTLHLFDTFTGLPADDAIGKKHVAGEFSCPLSNVLFQLIPYHTEAHAGRFPETTRGLEAVRYSCVHLDADLMPSTLDAIDYFWPRLVPGGALVLDDYGWKDTPGVTQAIHERFAREQIKVQAIHQAIIRKGPEHA